MGHPFWVVSLGTRVCNLMFSERANFRTCLALRRTELKLYFCRNFVMFSFLFLLSKGVNWEGGWEWMINADCSSENFCHILPAQHSLNCPPPPPCNHCRKIFQKQSKPALPGCLLSAYKGNEEAPVLLFLAKIFQLWYKNFQLRLC